MYTLVIRLSVGPNADVRRKIDCDFVKTEKANYSLLIFLISIQKCMQVA